MEAELFRIQILESNFKKSSRKMKIIPILSFAANEGEKG